MQTLNDVRCETKLKLKYTQFSVLKHFLNSFQLNRIHVNELCRFTLYEIIANKDMTMSEKQQHRWHVHLTSAITH